MYFYNSEATLSNLKTKSCAQKCTLKRARREK